MGLEKLKSIFSDIQPMNQTDLSKSPTQFDNDFNKTDLSKFNPPEEINVNYKISTMDDSLLLDNLPKQISDAESHVGGTYKGPVDFISQGQYGNSIPDGFTNNMQSTLMFGGATTLHGTGGGSLYGPVNFITKGQYGNTIPDGFTLNMSSTKYTDVQTTLHSVDGIQFPGPVNYITQGQYGNTIPDGFTLNFSAGSPSLYTGVSTTLHSVLDSYSGINYTLDTNQYWNDINSDGLVDFGEVPSNDFPTPNIENRPIVNNYSQTLSTISDSNFESNSGLSLSNYNELQYDAREGRLEWKKIIYTSNPYTGTKFDDGLGGIFNQSTKYFSAGASEPTPTFEKIIAEGNVTTGPGYQTKQPSLAIFQSGNTALEKYQNGNNVGSTWFKDGVNTLPYTAPILGDSYASFNPLIRGMNGVNAGLGTRTIQVDLDNLISDTLSSTQGWESLYNSDHTAKADKGYNYPNVDRSKLNMRYDVSKNSPIYVSGFNRQGPGGESGREPYHISDIGDTRMPGRNLPAQRSLTDIKRLGKYYLSAAGGAEFVIENLRVAIANAGKWYQGGIEATGGRYVHRFNRAYGQLLSGIPAATRPLGYATPMFLMDRGFPIDTFSYNHSTYENFISNNSDGNKRPLSMNERKVPKADDARKVTSKDNVRTSIHTKAHSSGKFVTGGESWKGDGNVRGDKMTLAPIAVQGNWPDASGQTNGAQTAVKAINSNFDIESESHGMPFYFKNMINGEYIIFRGYLDGLTENVVPAWEEEGYVGRSEPVYVYSRTTRDLSFNLNIVAQSPNEMEMIAIKLNKLTGLCYPSYKNDTNLKYLIGTTTLDKTRMTPPLIKLRIGEWMGNSTNDGQLGFLRTINYTVPETSTWETKQGKRIPKQYTAAITFQIISNGSVFTQENGNVDSADRFYGYTLDTKATEPFSKIQSS